MPAVYKTNLGTMECGDSRELLARLPDNSINLVITSPPFALQRQKEYGNVEQREYVDWLMAFARLVHQKLRPDGSFVLDLGGAYMKGIPARSLYNFRVLIRFCDEIGFFLAQDFYWFNPSKLPSPIEWVNKRKVRAKDSVNTVWWFSKTEHPKANVTKVLTPYSDRMKKLLADPETGEIIGGCCVGPSGGELIHEIIAAMSKRMTVQELASMPHYHPTLAEIWTYPAEDLAAEVLRISSGSAARTKRSDSGGVASRVVPHGKP